MTSWLICHGDARHLPLRDESVQCVVTSPPYFGLRNYDLDPLIWDGKAECQHDWGPPIHGSSHSGSLEGSTLQGTPPDQERRPVWRSTFCLRCSAWRGSLGLEPTIELYVEHLVAVFREIHRVLRKDGTVWLNMGDGYASAWPAPNTRRNIIGNPMTDGKRGPQRQSKLGGGLKEKDLIGMPWRLALALQADGWWLRSDIIWSKPNPMPESVTDRPTRSHEYLFLLTKSERYYYDAEAVKEPMRESTVKRLSQQTFDQQTGGPKDYGHRTNMNRSARKAMCNLKEKLIAQEKWGDRHAGLAERDPSLGCNRRSVWTIATYAFSGAHFATFPPALVEICLKAGTSEKGCCPACGAPWVRVVERTGHVNTREPAYVPGNTDTKTDSTGWAPLTRATGNWRPTCSCPPADPVPQLVLDPFSGSGTVGLMAQRLGLRFVGVDLSSEYCTMATKRITADMPLFNTAVF